MITESGEEGFIMKVEVAVREIGLFLPEFFLTKKLRSLMSRLVVMSLPGR